MGLGTIVTKHQTAVAKATAHHLGYDRLGRDGFAAGEKPRRNKGIIEDNTMRVAAGLILASAMSVAMMGAAWSQTPAAKPAAATQAAPAAATVAAPAAAAAAAPAAAPAAAAPAAFANPPPPAQAAQPARAACSNPNALGVARTVEIDTTGGPGFGFEHFKELDFLRDHEVVLTFDDGPWPRNTPAVLKALADQCTTGIFFPIGLHSTYEPEILKQVYAAGHTIGAHTWSHANLNNKKLTEQQRKDEIEKGFSAVKWALGGISPSPFFRFPALQHPPEMVTYLGTRNIAIFSCDLDSFDFKASKPEKVIDTVMKKLDKLGKGIILMHDFQKHTAEALPELLNRLKAGGFKVVAMRAKAPVSTLPEYDQELLKDVKLPTVSQRPVSSVVTTVSE
jgi:peptidoglycan/xylan/chitin deacetylase (PgdA/CDA1 family)